jgi:hypothetical protein
MLVSQHDVSGDFMVEQVPLDQVSLHVSFIIFVPSLLHTDCHHTLRHATALGRQHCSASLVLKLGVPCDLALYLES